MDTEQINQTLSACEQALATGQDIDLRALGYWRAVSAVKRHPEWVEAYADRVAEIDRRAFERSVRMRFPLGFGIALLTVGTIVGLALAVIGATGPRRKSGILFALGAGMLIVTTHDLAHFLVGGALGIRFSHAFLGGKGVIEPGLKIDYRTYLRTPPRRRAWMHASGAIATKLLAVLAVMIAVCAALPSRISALLAGGAGLAILVDVFFSTRYSDWKRFQREMRVAESLERSRR